MNTSLGRNGRERVPTLYYTPRRILAPGTEHFQTRCSTMIGGASDGAGVDWSEWHGRTEIIVKIVNTVYIGPRIPE